MDQKSYEMDHKELKYMKKGFLDQEYLFFALFLLAEFGSYLENPDSFEIIRKIGSHLENLNSFEIIRKIGSHLEKSG